MYIGGTPSQRMSSLTVTPRSRIAACSASASGTVKRMPVSVRLAGRRRVRALRAIDVRGSRGATSIQRMVGLMGASSRFSNPSVST